jgi:transposase
MHGLLRASFIPPIEQRDLRDLIRHRTNFIRERANLVNRVQKVLEGGNIKLASVVSDVMGVSARTILDAIVKGESNPQVMAELASKRLKDKREQLVQAMSGKVRPHQRFILAELLCNIDSIEETIERFNQQIQEYCSPFEKAVELLDTIPGVARQTAELIVAEIGTDMSRFPSANHLAAWAGVAPGNCESAGKRLSSKIRKGNNSLKVGLVQAAHAATRTKGYLAAQYRRIAARRGKKRAIIAVAHSILKIAYHLILRQESYQDLGGNYFDKQKPEATKKRLVKRLQTLGYEVSLTELQTPSPTIA